MIDDDAPEQDVRPVSAEVNYDGSLTIMLAVPGADELEPYTIEGDRRTVLMTYHGRSKAIDFGGATADDRYCVPLIERGVRRLNEAMARQRERLGPHRAEWTDD